MQTVKYPLPYTLAVNLKNKKTEHEITNSNNITFYYYDS
jgi:hypothetical protein